MYKYCLYTMDFYEQRLCYALSCATSFASDLSNRYLACHGGSHSHFTFCWRIFRSDGFHVCILRNFW